MNGQTISVLKLKKMQSEVLRAIIVYFLCLFVNNSILLDGQTRISNRQTKIISGQTISVLKLKKMQSELLRSVLSIFYVYLLITRFC
jgi:hypothetical protein